MDPHPLGRHVAYAHADLTWTTGPIEHHLVNRCHAVAVVEERTRRARLSAQTRILVCESAQGWRFLPGGTREADETVAELVARELLEEAGAEVRGATHIVAGWRASSHLDEPYRPHLAHPHSVWAMALVDAIQVTMPTCPPGGEQIVTVHTMPAAEAIRWLADSEDDLHAVALSAMLSA